MTERPRNGLALHCLLVVDDDELPHSLVEGVLIGGAWRCLHAVDAENALPLIDDCDALLTDIQMPGIDGIELLRIALERRPELDVIMMTAHGSITSAVEAMKAGARAYLTKPINPDELLAHLRGLEKTLDLRRAAASIGRGGLIGASEPMRRVYAEIDLAAGSTVNVLIEGTTGSGKEPAARAIHALSTRRSGPFVAVNLSAIPKELAESELFGHEKGAFTGAHDRKPGRFALAEGGTLFLDEVNSCPSDLQAKLLRAIENREIWPLGARKSVRVDARIIAASNVPLESLVARGEFREDLYYRLHVLPVRLPPLDEHPDDIPLIARAALKEIGGRVGAAIEIEPPALAALMTRSWPGNVRQLLNVLERAAARARAHAPGPRVRIEPAHVDATLPAAPVEMPFREAKAKAADNWAREAIRIAILRADGNLSEAARQLRMSRSAIMKLIEKYGLRSEN